MVRRPKDKNSRKVLIYIEEKYLKKLGELSELLSISRPFLIHGAIEKFMKSKNEFQEYREYDSKEKFNHFIFSLPINEYQDLSNYIKEKDISMSRFIREIIIRSLEANPLCTKSN